MDLIVTCECGAQLRAEEQLRGKMATCPACGSRTKVEADPGQPQAPTGGIRRRGLFGFDSDAATPPPLTISADTAPKPKRDRKAINFRRPYIYALCLAGLVFLAWMIYAIWPEPKEERLDARPVVNDQHKQNDHVANSNHTTLDELLVSVEKELAVLQVEADSKNYPRYENARQRVSSKLGQLRQQVFTWNVTVVEVTSEHVAVRPLATPRTGIAISCSNEKALRIGSQISRVVARGLSASDVIPVEARLQDVKLSRVSPNSPTVVNIAFGQASYSAKDKRSDTLALQTNKPTPRDSLQTVSGKDRDKTEQTSDRSTDIPIEKRTDAVSAARMAMAQNDFNRVIELLENADEGLRKSDETKAMLLKAKIALHLERGQKQLAADNPADAVMEFAAALRLNPDDATVISLLSQAKQAAGYRKTPFVEPFSNVPDGQLPDGWVSDNSVVVKHRGGSSWIESSAEGEHLLTTPPIQFPPDFELRVATWLNDDTKVKIALLDENADVVKQVSVNREYRGDVNAGFDGTPTIKLGRVRGTVPIRLVRDGRKLRLFVKDRETTQSIDVFSSQLRKVAATIQGGRRNSAIEEFSLRRHFKDIPVFAESSFSETFDNVKAGQLPAQWTGSNAVGVKRLGRNSWLAADAAGYHELYTSPIRFPSDFELRMNVALPSSSLEVSLIGAGNTPDLVMNFAGRELSRGGEVTAQYTGTVSRKVSVPNLARIPVRLVREGATYRLSVGGVENVLSDRKPTFRDFCCVAFRWEIERYPVAIHDVSVRSLSGLAKDRPPAQPPGALTGQWRIEKSGDLYQLDETGDVIQMKLLESQTLLSSKATLARRDQWWHGTTHVVFQEDATRRTRTLKLRMRKIDDTSLRVIQEHVAFKKSSGREIGRQEVYTRMVRVPDP